jgi:hypothetical protein
MGPLTKTSTADTERKIMRNTWIGSERPSARRYAAAVASAAFALLLAGYAQTSLARQPGLKTFSTAEEASHALYLAVKGNDEKAVAAILGADSELVSSNDKGQDRRDRARFTEKYGQMHRLVREPDASTVLYIGAENWPFPIPLASEHGAWHFDAKAGMEEVLFRRIGKNELNASQACHALVLAEREHKWPERDSSMQALRTLLGNAASQGPGVAFHGYYFRSLASHGKDAAPSAMGRASDHKTPGGEFAFVAYPAAYGSTGVMTYVVNQDGAVYAKDLGPNTGHVANGMTGYEPDSTWHPDE